MRLSQQLGVEFRGEDDVCERAKRFLEEQFSTNGTGSGLYAQVSADRFPPTECRSGFRCV